MSDTNELSTKTKIFVLIVTCLVVLAIYMIYKNNNKSSDTSPTFTNLAIPQKIQEALNNISTANIYLYSDKNFNKDATGKLYMKDDKGKYWDCGMGIDCLGATSNAIPIQDIYKFYNCAEIPDQYKEKCALTPGDGTKFVPILIQTAKDYEDFIQKSLAGTYTPNISECVSSTTDGGGENIAQIIGQEFMTLEKYLWSRRTEIIELVLQLGAIEAASRIIGHYAIIFFLIPSLLSGDTAKRIQGGIMGGQVAIQQLLKWGIGRSSELLASRTVEEEAQIISDSGGELFTSTISSITRTAGTLSLEALNFGAAVLGKLMSFIGVIQLGGMFLDAIDPCGLSGGEMNQDILNNLKTSYDQALSSSSGGISYPAIWDASMICDYQLNSNFYWQNCMSEEDKAKTTQKDFCKKDTDTFNNYFQEYLSALTVNSNGQTISKRGGGYSNQMLQKILEDNVPGVDWSAIGKIQPSDIHLPTDKNLKQLDLLFTDQNVILASYVYQYWWLFLIFFIFIIILVFIF